jgi:membrane fusion protein (multidrug efflux system)
VDIKIDAMPHHKFSGRVDSLQTGTGSNFALLPPDNATGNFIKIVQRIPVKILFEPNSIFDVREKIVPGLSTESSVTITEGPTGRHQPITQGKGQPVAGAVQ